MATRDLTRRFAELRVLRHGADGAGLETKRPGDAFSESGLLDVSHACGQPSAHAVPLPERSLNVVYGFLECSGLSLGGCLRLLLRKHSTGNDDTT